MVSEESWNVVVQGYLELDRLDSALRAMEGMAAAARRLPWGSTAAALLAGFGKAQRLPELYQVSFSTVLAQPSLLPTFFCLALDWAAVLASLAPRGNLRFNLCGRACA